MSQEEMDEMVQEMRIRHAESADGSDGEEIVMKKVIHIDKRKDHEGEGPEDEVEIRVKIEDGVEIIEATKNGVELSEVEARELLDKENIHVVGDGAIQKEMIFISEEEISDGENVFIQKHEIRTNDETENMAIAIIKEFAAMGTEEAIDAKTSRLSIYPNPATEEIKAQLEGVEGKYTVTLTNLAGQMIRKEVGNASNSAQHTTNLKGVPAGTYILSIDHEGGLKSEKFVVE